MTAEERLGSSYLLGERIGSGTFGEVRRAADRDGHPWAVKILRREYAQDPDVVRRFVQERHVLSGIRHPNIVEVHDLVIEGDTLAIVMDHVEGSTLRALLDAEGTLPPAQVADIGRQLASALVAVHARDVIHRDLKPDNVLLDADTDPATPRLSDFGIAEIISERVEDASFVGTPAYLAPEVAEGHAPTAASDLYSLGIVLYELSCGRTPFADRDNVIATLTAQVAAPPPRPPDLPDDLWDVIAALLSKSPARRPASAGVAEMWLDGLTESLSGLPAATPLAVAATVIGTAPAGALGGSEDDEATQAMPVAATPGTASAAAPSDGAPSDGAPPTESAEASTPPLTALPPPSTPPVRLPMAPAGHAPGTGRPAHPTPASPTSHREAGSAAAPADAEPKRRVAPLLAVAASLVILGGGILVATQPEDQPLITKGPLGAVGLPTLSAGPSATASTSPLVPADLGPSGWAGTDQLSRQVPRIQGRDQATPSDANQGDPTARTGRGTPADPDRPTSPPLPGDRSTRPGPGASPTGSGPDSSTTPDPTTTPTARPTSTTASPTIRPRPSRTPPTPSTSTTRPSSTTTPPPHTTTDEPPTTTPPPPEPTPERPTTTRDEEPEPPTSSAFRSTTPTGDTGDTGDTGGGPGTETGTGATP